MKIIFQDSRDLEMKMKIQNEISFFLSPFDIFIISYFLIFENKNLFSKFFFIFLSKFKEILFFPFDIYIISYKNCFENKNFLSKLIIFY